jgi:hypothetical protein
LRRQATLAAAERARLGWPVSQPFQNRQAASMTPPGKTRDATRSKLFAIIRLSDAKSTLAFLNSARIPAHKFRHTVVTADDFCATALPCSALSRANSAKDF